MPNVISALELDFKNTQALSRVMQGVSALRGSPVAGMLPDVILGCASGLGMGAPTPAGRQITKSLHDFSYAEQPKISRYDNRNLTASFTDPVGPNTQITKSQLLSKAVLDVGTLTNFADVVGGQAMGFVSLDTRMARATARPRSMTLYQALAKTPAYQIVDFWPYIGDTGGALPGSAYTGFTTVSTGALGFNSGDYRINYIDLKLAVDGRGVTTALAAQNSFVNIADAETANAAISILESMDWALYWGNASLYANIPEGIYNQVKNDAEGAQNIINYYNYWSNTAKATGVTEQQALFNLIYDTFAKAVGYRVYARPTHAFMSPELYGGLQSLVTSQLNNLVNVSSNFQDAPLVINADYRGIRTGFGNLAFEIDLFLTARLRAAEGIIRNGQASSGTAVTKPVSVTLTAGAPATGTVSYFDSTYAGTYSYAVAATDASRNETALVWASPITVPEGDVVTVTINPPTDGSAVAFIIYRSGLGYSYTSTDTTAPYQVRFIGEVLANGTTAVTFVDSNANIPGSQSVFLLDLDSEDDALDYRYLLPLSRINLFQDNLFMPWAVVHIGAPRVRIPKFHAVITNVVIPTLGFNPLSASNPSPLG